ncbi:hypothetical protein EOM82_05445 [bacterium]|nr:hypothetical protein [bacterium]
MGIFKTKAEKELEKKMAVKKTVNSMRQHIAKLDQQKKVYIDSAKKAMQQGLAESFKLAKSGLKMCLAQQKKAQEMLLNFEIASQMKDMAKMTSEFLQGLKILSNDMVELTNEKEFAKVQLQFEQAMNGVETQTEMMDNFLSANQSTFETASADPNSISDDEINKLLIDQTAEDLTDGALQKELDDLKKRLASM